MSPVSPQKITSTCVCVCVRERMISKKSVNIAVVWMNIHSVDGHQMGILLYWYLCVAVSVMGKWLVWITCIHNEMNMGIGNVQQRDMTGDAVLSSLSRTRLLKSLFSPITATIKCGWWNQQVAIMQTYHETLPTPKPYFHKLLWYAVNLQDNIFFLSKWRRVHISSVQASWTILFFCSNEM